jgi:hypothetical protein
MHHQGGIRVEERSRKRGKEKVRESENGKPIIKAL